MKATNYIKIIDTYFFTHREKIVSINRYECVDFFHLLLAMTIEPLLYALDEPSIAHLLTKWNETAHSTQVGGWEDQVGWTKRVVASSHEICSSFRKQKRKKDEKRNSRNNG